MDVVVVERALEPSRKATQWPRNRQRAPAGERHPKKTIWIVE